MTLELLLVLPILLVMLLGLFEFSFLFYARSEIVEASRAGARLATLHGVHSEEVEVEVRRSLGGKFGAQLEVLSALEARSGEEVSVAVRVPMTAAAPDLLWPIGYSIQDRHLMSETRMLKE